MKISELSGVGLKVLASRFRNHVIKRPNRLLLAGILSGSLSATHAQITPSPLLKADTSTVIEEKLVALALQGPESKNLEHQNKINEYQLKNAQNAWLNLLSFSLNYNEQSFAKQTTATTYVYPRYFFGLTVPLGTLLSRTQVKSAKESIEMGKNNQELLRRSIREDILAKYKQYKALSQLIAIQSELVNDVQTQLVQMEEKFRKGTATIENYNGAQKGYNGELAGLINLKLQQDIKKLEIEKMIGVKLETVTNR